MIVFNIEYDFKTVRNAVEYSYWYLTRTLDFNAFSPYDPCCIFLKYITMTQTSIL